jgi:hypothetical protein
MEIRQADCSFSREALSRYSALAEGSRAQRSSHFTFSKIIFQRLLG